jgi:2,3-bisphosphoglycerate-independent phosphoglycerate mutase
VATALERAHTPVLDSLAAEGSVLRVATTPEGLPAGSETGIPTLLGVPPSAPVGRGWIDAAGYGIDVPHGLTPWRADLVYVNGRRASIRQARDICTHLGSGAHAVAGHRLVLVARERPADRRLLGLHVRVWPDGASLTGRPTTDTTVICAAGAAAGCARLLGATVVVPPGATGDVDTDLRAKAGAATAAIARGAGRVVVHVGGPDEAAHRGDVEAVMSVLERADAELLAPLLEAVAVAGGRLAVCPDHTTDPITGRHGAAPVPAVVWGARVPRRGPRVVTEAAAIAAPFVRARELLAAPTAVVA